MDDGKIESKAYEDARMRERVAMLADELPEFVVENKFVWSIVSLGLHDLDEELCLEADN